MSWARLPPPTPQARSRALSLSLSVGLKTLLQASSWRIRSTCFRVMGALVTQEAGQASPSPVLAEQPGAGTKHAAPLPWPWLLVAAHNGRLHLLKTETPSGIKRRKGVCYSNRRDLFCRPAEDDKRTAGTAAGTERARKEGWLVRTGEGVQTWLLVRRQV